MKTNMTWVNGNGERVILDVEQRAVYSDVVAIAEVVVNEVYKEGKYRPYMKPVALYKMLLEVYVGLKFPDTNSMMEAIETTNLAEFVNLIDQTQYEELNEYIDQMLAHEEKKGSIDTLCDYFMLLSKSGNILKMAEEITNSMQSANKEQET